VFLGNFVIMLHIQFCHFLLLGSDPPLLFLRDIYKLVDGRILFLVCDLIVGACVCVNELLLRSQGWLNEQQDERCSSVYACSRDLVFPSSLRFLLSFQFLIVPVLQIFIFLLLRR